MVVWRRHQRRKCMSRERLRNKLISRVWRNENNRRRSSGEGGVYINAAHARRNGVMSMVLAVAALKPVLWWPWPIMRRGRIACNASADDEMRVACAADAAL